MQSLKLPRLAPLSSYGRVPALDDGSALRISTGCVLDSSSSLYLPTFGVSQPQPRKGNKSCSKVHSTIGYVVAALPVSLYLVSSMKRIRTTVFRIYPAGTELPKASETSFLSYQGF